MAAETYTCAHCGNVYEKVRPDEEALAESRKEWGDLPPEEQAVVCEDCYQALTAWIKKNGVN